MASAGRATIWMTQRRARPRSRFRGRVTCGSTVLSGGLDPIQALVKRQLTLDGNLVKIMKHVKAAQELVKCAATVPIAAQ